MPTAKTSFEDQQPFDLQTETSGLHRVTATRKVDSFLGLSVGVFDTLIGRRVKHLLYFALICRMHLSAFGLAT